MSKFSGTEYTFLKNIEGFDQTLQTSLNEDDGYISDAGGEVASNVVKNTYLMGTASEVHTANIENPGQAITNTTNATIAYNLPPGKGRDTVIEDLYGADADKVKEIVDAYRDRVELGGDLGDSAELTRLISIYQAVQTGANRTEAARAAVEDTAPDAILNDPDAKKAAEDKIRKNLKKKNVPADEAEDAAKEEAEKILDGVLKFGPQRYLLKNISTLAMQSEYRSFATGLGIPHTKVVTLQDSSTNAIGRLTKRENAPKIMGLTTAQLSTLVPKIKLFKIKYDDDMNEKGRIPLKFPKGSGQGDGSQWQPDINDIFEYNSRPTSTNNPSKFYKTRAAYGIQSFSWSYIGSDPWSANRDITASLVLYFQDFAQLSVQRVSSSGGKYRYLDLLLSVSDEKFHKTGTKKNYYERKKMYQQDIIAEVGWATPNSFTDEEKDIVTNNSVSLVLTMEDYSFTFDEGGAGSFTLQIDYRARAERITRDKLINVIAPKTATVKKLQKLQDEMDKIKSEEGVDDESYTDKKEEFDKALKESKAESYTRLNESLAKTQSIYYTDISLEDIIKAETTPAAASKFSSKGGGEKTKDYLKQCIDAKSTEPLLTGAIKQDDGTHRFYYTFLGDVIQAAMDIGTDSDVAKLFGSPAVIQNYKVILCDFFVGTQTYNLADMPIEYGLLASFYYDEIQSKDTQTKTIGMFIKELLAYVVHNKIESYFNEKKGDSRSFRASFLTMNTDIPTSRPTLLSALTLEQGPNIPYLVVHAISSASDLNILPGEYSEAKKRDEANNLAHLTLGNKDSIIKNISFNKLDWEYAREHRLVDNAGSPFNILANVFNVTVKLFGNTLFYPGSMVFINPISMGDIGRPWVKGSISNIMGLGGYHYVIKVDNSISDSVFETSFDAIWQTSGSPKEGFIKKGSGS